MTPDDRAMLRLIEQQAVGLRCIAETLLAMVSSLVASDASTAEQTLPDASTATVPEPEPDLPRVFGGRAGGVMDAGHGPIFPPPGPNGIIGG